jgi:ribosome-associated protein
MTEESFAVENGAAPLDADGLARLVASLLSERKGEDIVVLRMTDVLPLTDYFVIATGRNARHVDALREHVEIEVKKRGVHRINHAGVDGKVWILLDYGGVVVHVFQPQAREHYDLELLWADAERVDLTEAAP